MVDNKTIGARIKERRKNRNLSVEECCTAVGISPSAWRMYECGERIPRDETKEAIADFFRCSIYSIFFKT